MNERSHLIVSIKQICKKCGHFLICGDNKIDNKIIKKVSQDYFLCQSCSIDFMKCFFCSNSAHCLHKAKNISIPYCSFHPPHKFFCTHCYVSLDVDVNYYACVDCLNILCRRCVLFNRDMPLILCQRCDVKRLSSKEQKFNDFINILFLDIIDKYSHIVTRYVKPFL